MKISKGSGLGTKSYEILTALSESSLPAGRQGLRRLKDYRREVQWNP
jgi:hypothetical protein